MASANNGSINNLIVDGNGNLMSQSGQASEYMKTAAPQSVDGAAQNSHEASDAQQKLQSFWQTQMEAVQNISANEFKTQELPLARIKKIMKMDDDVKMISAEAPLLFSKAAQIFITELSLRAWIHTEDSKRRTLQRNDIATAITKFDQFDFLIDIVPREELKPAKRTFGSSGSDGLQLYYTVPQQTGGTVTASNSTASLPQATIPVSALQSGQLVLAQPSQQNGQPVTLTAVNVDNNQQVLQLAQPTQPAATTSQNQHRQDATSSSEKSAQAILQQLVSSLPGATPGEVHSIQMNAQGQLQLVKVANPQNQTSGQDGNIAQRLAGSNQVFELATQQQQVEGDASAGATHNVGTIYMGQDS